MYYQTTGSVSGPTAPHLHLNDYDYSQGESRLFVWIVAQQHLYWGGFVLGSLLLVTLLEICGLLQRGTAFAPRVDGWAHEVLGLILLGLSVTAVLGGLFLFFLLIHYPDLTTYLLGVFRPAVAFYGVLALVLMSLTYVYFYSWGRMAGGGAKYVHAALGVVINVAGTTLMMIGNAWSSFMMSPAGVDEYGRFLGNIWHAIHTATWNPMNVHRLVSHLVLGAAVLAAYAAYRLWTARSSEERTRYDWAGNQSFTIMILAFFTLPFGGYWLALEISAYNMQMAITLHGGLLAWLAVVQVIIVGGFFLGINYYVWQRIDAAGGIGRYGRYRKYLFFVLAVCYAIFATPHVFVMTPGELKAMGELQHPVLGNYGVETAKVTAVNLMIVVTLWSLVLLRFTKQPEDYRASNWPTTLMVVWSLVGSANLVWLGVYSFYIPANVRIGLLLGPMVGTTISLGIVCWALSGSSRSTASTSSQGFGALSVRGVFALFFLAFAATWSIGLGGYLKSSARLFWHVKELVRDQSPWAFTHSAGFAVNVITLNALLFWAGLLLLFWLTRTSQTRTTAFAAHRRPALPYQKTASESSFS